MKKNKKLLIISYYFPPFNIIGSMRFGEMVKYLERYGWQCHVLTVHSKGDLDVNLPQSRIIRIGNISKRKKVNFKNIIEGEVNIDDFIFKLLGKMNINFRMLNMYPFTWSLKVLKELKKYESLFKDTDMILATYNPSDDLWLAKYISRKYNIPFVADFRDLGALLPMKRNKITDRIDFLLEKTVLKNAKALTSVSPTLANILKREHKKKSKVIYNGWDNFTEYKEKHGGYLYYAGGFYSHRMESVYMLIETLKKFPDIKLKIHSQGPEVLLNKIREFAKKNNVENIELFPPIKQKEVFKEANNALANLVFESLEKKNEAHKGNLTGKFLQLIALSPPVLSIARDDNDMGNILNETKKGKLCSTSKQIEKFLIELTGNREKYKGNDKVFNYSKENQAKKLSNLLNEVLENSKEN